MDGVWGLVTVIHFRSNLRFDIKAGAVYTKLHFLHNLQIGLII
jgi:hypothetical protein